MIVFAGAVLFGIVIGWLVHSIDQYRDPNRDPKPWASDLATIAGIIGGGAITLLNGDTTFAGFSIGLFVGFLGPRLAQIVPTSISSSNRLETLPRGRRRLVEGAARDDTATAARPDQLATRITQALPQTRRDPPTGQLVRTIDGDATVHLSVVLKPATPYDEVARFSGRGSNSAQLHAQYRTSDKVIDQLVQFVLDNGFQVDYVDPDHHTVNVSGTLLKAQRAFCPDHLGVYSDGNNEFVARSGSLSVPRGIADQVVAVMGLDQRPAVRPYLKYQNQTSNTGSSHGKKRRGSRLRANASDAAGPAYDPLHITRRYKFPGGSDGKGQTIALIELGGGYDKDEIARYFVDMGVARTGILEDRFLNGATNSIGSGPTAFSDGHQFNTYDAEVQMDIQIVGSVAPAADIIVYFAPNTAQGFYSAILQAIRDKRATIISASWGFPESSWQPSDIDALNQLFQSCQADVTICVASGDRGATDGVTSGVLTTDFPSSSPNVLACGGTICPIDGSETAWNAGDGHSSGGGFSARFNMPPYQFMFVVGNKRGVPDVAGHTIYNARINGQDLVLSGTSAVAPLWAGLVALLNQHLARPIGFINANLYQSVHAFNDVASGSNGTNPAIVGWDPVTGLGSPDGEKLLAALQKIEHMSALTQ